mmetsp:Transcript_104383/g.164813  ORF Transcript_104383/g.164813 Transcript_104383/m.164813 type:complete len:429 (-) Transcript_104383:26-1312(-)
MNAPQKLEEPLGEAPHIEIILQPTTQSCKCELVNAAGYLALANKNATVGELYEHVCSHLAPDLAQMLTPFVHDGKTLEPSLTLHENHVPLPGPAARRQGKGRIILMFDLKQDVLDAKRDYEEHLRHIARKEEELRQNAIKEEEMRKKKEIEEEERRAAELQGLRIWVEKNIGVSRTVSLDMRAKDPELEEPKNYLEPCSREECDALGLLLKQSQGKGFSDGDGFPLHVLEAYKNDNPTLWERYEYSRTRMQQASGSIQRRKSHTAQIVTQREFEILGRYDPSVNEFPLWHGTPTTAGAQGICKNGFDINFVGTTTDSGWYGPGFYFCDESGVSMGYGRSTHYVNSTFPACQVILLNRVVAGNVRVQHRIADGDEVARGRVTAECLGPGGVFGPQSKFHSLLGQGNEYVCMSSHQVYPEYVIIFNTGSR